MTNEPNSLREAVAAAVKARGGTARVSREADLSPLTVKAYLAGSQVHRQTLAKLQKWASAQGEVSPQVRKAAAAEVQKREPPPVWRDWGGLHGSGG